MSRHMGKPTICVGENKGADQLRSDCEADQCLCFRYSESTVPLLLKSEISRFWLFSVTVQVGLCRTWSETTLLVFPRGGSYRFSKQVQPKGMISSLLSQILESRRIAQIFAYFLSYNNANHAIFKKKCNFLL